ncbi:MAG TPA: threonine synthase [Terriglobales bacterium]|nr:threonine synthase [Terriglobales bacterium]
MSRVTHLECTKCSKRFSPETPQNVCPEDAGVLFARYDLQALKQDFKPALLPGREASLWRYREVLPEVPPVTLGEGFTPILRSREFPNVWIKDEGLNPTGSFKARGVSVAISVAKALGLKKLAMPSAGNAAGALAAYAAASGLEAHIFMPRDVPAANRMECEAYGAKITLVNGLISDCARMVSERKDKEGWFDLSTLKEPYRVEGKKTMAYELFEQLGGRLPDAIIFPTGGGVGVIGMWKAFDEMEQLGWIGADRPRMIAVQAQGCAPIVKAFREGKASVEPWKDASTIAAGLRVPKPYGDYLVLDILRRSRGTAIAVSDQEVRDAVRHWASKEGIFAAPEGAAGLAAYRKLRQAAGTEQPFLLPDDSVVLFNTGTGLKYLDVLQDKKDPPNRQIGGIIGPY